MAINSNPPSPKVTTRDSSSSFLLADFVYAVMIRHGIRFVIPKTKVQVGKLGGDRQCKKCYLLERRNPQLSFCFALRQGAV